MFNTYLNILNISWHSKHTHAHDSIQVKPPSNVVDSRLRSCGGCRFNALFRLCVHLRCAPFGADSTWMKNPRRLLKTRKLNWYQENCRRLAETQQKSASARDRVRAGRLERWRQQGEKLRESFAVPLTQPECIESFGVICILLFVPFVSFF